MRTRWLMLAASALWCSAPSHVEAERYACPRSAYQVDLAVVYANGMSNNKQEANASREALRKLIAPALGLDPYAITFDIAYNSSEPALLQLWQVAKQRAPMSVSLFVRIVNGLVPAPDWFADAMKKVAAEIDLAAFVDDKDLEDQVQGYRDHLRKGQKVIVLAHSQGNLYANAAYRRLFQTAQPTPGEQDFGIVAVASPAPTVAGPTPDGCPLLGCYVTLDEDLVIGAVRKAFKDTLASNVTAPVWPAGDDLLGHGLLETYLKLDITRELILHDVVAQLNSFEPLTITVPDAMITASLEWDSAADLDLHVYENGGREHVYYAYKEGAGELDADADAYGPENYSLACDAVKPGEFRFAVGYVAGDGPVNPRLRVTAGNTTRTFTKPLPEAQGRAANTDPTTLAWLHVAKRADGSYELMLVADE